MRIEQNMNLHALAIQLGPDATEQDAADMRDKLMEAPAGRDTQDIADDEWHAIMDSIWGKDCWA